MTRLVLDRPVLTLADDPNGPPLFLLRSDLPAFDPGLSGEVREYAGGERISSARAGTSTVAVMEVVTDPAGLVTLEAWAGRTVCYRDGLGNKLFAVYFRTPWTPTLSGRLRLVELELATVTYREAA